MLAWSGLQAVRRQHRCPPRPLGADFSHPHLVEGQWRCPHTRLGGHMIPIEIESV